MLEIFNRLHPFIEDCYKRYSVREYAKKIKVSPPTASKILRDLNKENLLNSEGFRNLIFYWVNKEEKLFIDLSRIYWHTKLKDAGLLEYLEKELVKPTIILFGSLSKAENKLDSDIDLAILGTKDNYNPDLKKFERILKRKIQIISSNDLKSIKNIDLANNILNGYILRGMVRS
jgi:predicted nucleotidyltransferase